MATKTLVICANHSHRLARLHPYICLNKDKIHTRLVSTAPTMAKFWEPHIKGEYRKEEEFKIPSKKDIVGGLNILKKEVNLWQQEVRDTFTKEPLFFVQPGEVDNAFKFDSEESLRRWVVTTDRDNAEGNSTAELVLGPHRRAILRGRLDTTKPKDGVKQRSGYANMRCMRPRKSFMRDSYFDWTAYSHIVLRVRGDGRVYMLNLSSMGYFDVMWNDVYTFPLYTRGGPYWQITKIPFSRFFLTGKGRIQDKQSALERDRITHVGITCAGLSGQFQLEIDYIGLEFDPRHEESFAYESYLAPSFVVGT